jgi:hypothetical protein
MPFLKDHDMTPSILPMKIITPQIAAEIIEKTLRLSAPQRPSSPFHVKILADRIRLGLWDPTAGTISLAENGTVTDGMHRLRAIVSAGVQVSARVILSPWSPSADDGRRRSLSDRSGQSSRRCAVSRFAGKLCGVNDADIALSIFGQLSAMESLHSLKKSKPFGASTILLGGLAANLVKPDAGTLTIERLIASAPEGRQETAICRDAMAGKISSASATYDLPLRIFSAALRRPSATVEDMRNAIKSVL